MLKTVGIILIFLTTLGAGILFSKHIENGCRILHGFYRFICHIKSRISMSNESLERIYREAYEKNTFPEISDFIQNLAESRNFVLSLEKYNGIPSKTAYNILSDFAALIGKSDSENLLSVCESCLNVLKNELESTEKELPNRLKICRTLSLSLGLFIVIILL